MKSRGYNADEQKFLQHTDYKSIYIGTPELFSGWHNDVYLRQCLHNLEEKFVCGGISEEEWQRIYDVFKDFTPLVNK
jgi:hypothetical protein